MFKKYLVALFVLCGLSSSLMAENIYPISREMGSGTRGAFVDIFDVKKQIGNKKIDATSKKAEVTSSTGVMITTVANSKNAIGYISLGSLNDTVKAVKIDGVVLELTLKEFELLGFLLQNPNQVFSRDMLLEMVWGYGYDKESRTVDMHIKTLRKKLGNKSDIIRTIHGVGYKLIKD